MLNEWRFTPYNRIDVTPTGSVKQGKKTPICNTLICLDTETSHNHDEQNPIGWVYQWCFSFQGQLVYGRKPSQFIQALKTVCEGLQISENKKLMIFVHNLSYDIQYLKQYLIDAFGTDYKMLAVFSHKFISFEIGNIIFRCSYRLTNKSLAKFSKDMNAKHGKLVGAIDYDVIRYQDTPLKRKDWRYMFYDVVALHESITNLLHDEHDTLVSLPLTSTGFVRRDGRNASRKFCKNWHRKFTGTALSLVQYQACKSSFSGGITHGNRFYSEKTVTGTIKHYDFRSHYPTQLRVQDFPVGKFNLLGRNMDAEKLKPYFADYCLLVLLVFENAELRTKDITLPYMQASKVKQGMAKGGHTIEDNGRVLKFDGICKMWVTDVDLKILWKQYKFTSYNFETVLCSVKGKLPEWFVKFVDKYYFEKSDYKKQVRKAKAEKNEQKEIESELSLMKSKNRLNGIYGMVATSILRESYFMTATGDWSSEYEKSPEELIERFYKSRNNYLPFQWASWVTSYARAQLVEMVELVGYDNFLYCDTDSAFFIDDTGESERKIDEWNKARYNDSISIGAYIESDGEIVVYNQFENEKENITSFRFLHAKCYAYVTDGEKLKCVIAGVRDRKGKDTREKELQTIDNLKSGFVFSRMGGTKAVYTESLPYIIDGNEVASACIITPTTKTLNNSIEYFNFDFSEVVEC